MLKWIVRIYFILSLKWKTKNSIILHILKKQQIIIYNEKKLQQQITYRIDMYVERRQGSCYLKEELYLKNGKIIIQAKKWQNLNPTRTHTHTHIPPHTKKEIT